MSSNSVSKLLPITFQTLNVNEESKKLEGDTEYETKFLQTQSELKNFFTHSKESNFEKVCHQVLENFAKVKFLNPSYEGRVFEQITDKQIEFEWRQRRLLDQYKNLNKLYDSPYDTSESIKELIGQITNRQQQLLDCHHQIPDAIQRNYTLVKVYSKTLKHIYDIKVRQELAEKMISIWNRWNKKIERNETMDPYLRLRSQVYALFFLNNADLYQMATEEIVNTFEEIEIEKHKKLLKKIYGIFCHSGFDGDQVDNIFESISKKFGEESSLIKISYKSYCLVMHCKKLKVMQWTKGNDQDLLDKIGKLLRFLGEHYSSGKLDKSSWDKLYESINSLNISTDKKKPLLDLFLEFKSPPSKSFYGLSWNFLTWSSSFLSYLISDGESEWKGKKYLTILESTQQWIRDHQKWIEEKLGDDQDNSLVLKEKVIKILDFFKNLKYPTLPHNPSVSHKREFNRALRNYSRSFLTLLRDALSTNECLLDFERYSSLGEDRTSGCAVILLHLCVQRFAGVNMIPFMVNLMKNMIEIGLQSLAVTDTSYKPYLDNTTYPNLLDIGTEVIHKAIENVSQEHRAPFLSLLGLKLRNITNWDWDLHMQGAPNMNLLEMTFEGERKVTWLRFPSPTNSKGIILEFSALTRVHSILLCSLQSSVERAEAVRTDLLFNLNATSKRIFTTVFPVVKSNLFEQSDEYADTKTNQSPFGSSASFFQSIMKKIFPDPVSNDKPNQAGNYLFPPSWIVSHNFRKMLNECLEITHMIFFNKDENLLEPQRRAFIKFFDICLAFKLIAYTKTEYFAFLCNHSADRTGVFVTLMLKILLIAFEKEHAPIDPSQPESFTWNQVLEAFIDGVPMVVAKREMNSFHNGLLEALEILRKDDVRKRIIENKKLFGVTKFEFPFASKRDPNNNSH